MTSSGRTTRQKMKCEGRFDLVWTNWHDDSVTCVVPAGTSGTHIHLSRQYVDQLSLSFVSPLRAKHDCHCNRLLVHS